MHDLTTLNWEILIAAVFTLAFFYSSVGHGGATGYLAALALVSVAPASAKVVVLIANTFVASIAFWRFYQAGHFDCKIFLSFAVASIPFAFLGSKIHISPHTYKIILGAVLSIAGIILLFRSRWQTDDVTLRKCFLPAALLVGARRPKAN
jgi:uncharacterized membrane protein YfcA